MITVDQAVTQDGFEGICSSAVMYSAELFQLLLVAECVSEMERKFCCSFARFLARCWRVRRVGSENVTVHF